MAIGYVHIFAMPAAVVDSGQTLAARFQFTFNDGTHSYARVFDEDGLVEFLADELGLRADVLESLMAQLETEGKATMGDVELSDNQAAALGLKEAAVDL